VPYWRATPTKPTREEKDMFLGIGILLVLLWLGGFFMFHTAGFLIHILLILAVVSFVFHFLRGNTRAA
jgi:Family of unknown function (DUF5670)